MELKYRSLGWVFGSIYDRRRMLYGYAHANKSPENSQTNLPVICQRFASDFLDRSFSSA
jgi:hypothetical protein